jgi:hypothetical protein
MNEIYERADGLAVAADLDLDRVEAQLGTCRATPQADLVRALSLPVHARPPHRPGGREEEMADSCTEPAPGNETPWGHANIPVVNGTHTPGNDNES